MSKKNIKDNLVTFLNKYDFDYVDVVENHMFVSDLFLLNYENNNILISFHASTNPAISSRFVSLLMYEIKNLDVTIDDNFIYDKNNSFMIGEVADIYLQIQNQEIIIKKFVREQSEKFYLENVKGFEC